MSSKRTKATSISSKVRQEVKARDHNVCVICRRRSGVQVMHYVGRGAGGLGIPENLGMGCVECHIELDQGTDRDRYKRIFKTYLQNIYPDWDESKLKYRKYK